MEQQISRSLRSILDALAAGAPIPDSEQFRDVLRALESYLPAVLGEIHPEWQDETWDGILPFVARKTADREAEILGHCFLFPDQALAPFHSRLRIDPSGDEISGLEIKLGQRGPNGMTRAPEYKRLYALRDGVDDIDWACRATFGQRDDDQRDDDQRDDERS